MLNINGILSISGKPGLYKVVAQSKARIIIENIETKKRKPAFGSDRIIALTDITVFGHTEDLSLVEVFEKMYETEKGKKSIDYKESPEKLRERFETIWEEYDDQEVKDHDLKKIFQWYNILIENDLLKPIEENEPAEMEEE